MVGQRKHREFEIQKLSGDIELDKTEFTHSVVCFQGTCRPRKDTTKTVLTSHRPAEGKTHSRVFVCVYLCVFLTKGFS